MLNNTNTIQKTVEDILKIHYVIQEKLFVTFFKGIVYIDYPAKCNRKDY